MREKDRDREKEKEKERKKETTNVFVNQLHLLSLFN
jgi:hypothetical protein